jgi:hypothetical protein
VAAGEEANTLVITCRGAAIARWPVELRSPPDLGIVDDLARLRLALERLGWDMAVEHPCARLREVIDLAGLTEVLLARPEDDPAER